MPSTLNATTTNGLVTSADNSGSLQLQTNNGTTAVTIDTSQNVGIGTTSPSVRLDVASTGNTVLALRSTSSGSPAYYIEAAGGGTPSIVYKSTQNLRFATADDSAYTNYTERMRITSGGQLYVGATSTVFTNDTTGGSFQGNQTGGGKPILEVVNNNNTSSSDGCPAIIAAKGSSTTSSSARFIQFSASGAAQPMGGIVGNGATNCQFASISDAREKTNIQEISGSLEKINLLKPVEFDWIRDGSHVNAGFVAQDVQQVFPEFVVENMSDEGQEQRYGLTGGMTGGIIAHLVKAIQELKAELNEVKAELDATKAEVQALKGVA